ncbi:RepB family plasmid replication initiator protein [Lamprobacter modestohalophilus]|uniref:RepB family plasmid replication initiator protein n=1 Tax=Lamprobacter modestohalophilus TaxID=1064514 RepID=A0A9X0WDT7_9GAMM|nr:replication initiation protein [Lamprobacter modestohalophilus]MBK1621562.1 RepB family plasmid replication initiator protein [Lamprobacter modestohalophilus]
MTYTPLQVCKSNALVEASYRLSVAEQRIILACISQIRRDQQITDEVLYSVSATEIAGLTGTRSKTTYEELAKAAQRLKRREVRLFEEPNGRGRKPRVMVTGWVQTIVYIEEEGRVELRFTKDMLPYLSELTEQFTRYALADVAKMTSAYAIRLYELLIQWRGTGERVIEVDWLRDALQLEGRYSNIRDLKRWVLEPAVAQVNEFSPLWVTWDQRKTGRRVTHIVFSFGEKPNSKPTLPKPSQRAERVAPKLSLPKAYVEQHKGADEGLVEADQRLLFEIRTGRREPPPGKSV